MNNILRASIDVTLIDKDKLKSVTLKSGKSAKFLNVSMIPTPDSEYSSHVVLQDMGKNEAGEYNKGKIIGNVRRNDDKPKSASAKPKAKAEGDYQPPDDDVPF